MEIEIFFIVALQLNCGHSSINPLFRVYAPAGSVSDCRRIVPFQQRHHLLQNRVRRQFAYTFDTLHCKISAAESADGPTLNDHAFAAGGRFEKQEKGERWRAVGKLVSGSKHRGGALLRRSGGITLSKK